MTQPKRYILKRKYESPHGIVDVGVTYTAKEWQRWFPKMTYQDFDIKDDWFTPEETKQTEERTMVKYIDVFMTEGIGKDCRFYTNGDVPKEKLPAIKQAIEATLNNEEVVNVDKWVLRETYKRMLKEKNDEIAILKQLALNDDKAGEQKDYWKKYADLANSEWARKTEQAEERAWQASRLMMYKDAIPRECDYCFKTFQDYKQSTASKSEPSTEKFDWLEERAKNIPPEITERVEKMFDEIEKANEGFVWTDELVREFIMGENCGYSIELLEKQISGFKQSKQSLSSNAKRKNCSCALGAPLPISDPEHCPVHGKQAAPSNAQGRDWEILTCFTKSKSGEYHDYTPRNNDKTISNCDDDKCEIRSVKRLDKIGDQPIFTVGEETTFGVIKRFELKYDIMYWWNENTWYYLNQIIKQ